MPTPPMTSIVIPNHNKVRYIPETIQSVQNQTTDDWELIFVDDHSTDDSISVAHRIANSDSRISIHENHATQRGGSAARNHGLSKAKGRYIMFLDSDDIISPNCLSTRQNRFGSSETDFVVFPMGTFRNKLGDRKHIWRPQHKAALRLFLRHELPWGVMGPMFKRSFVEKVGGFDERFPRLQDVEFHTRCLMETDCRFLVFPDASPDCHYRVSTERTPTPPMEQLRRFTRGVQLYLDTFTTPAHRLGQKHVNALSVTLFRGIERICAAQRTFPATQDEIKPLLDSILSSEHARALPGWQKKLLYTYKTYAVHRQPAKGVSFFVRHLLHR